MRWSDVPPQSGLNYTALVKSRPIIFAAFQLGNQAFIKKNYVFWIVSERKANPIPKVNYPKFYYWRRAYTGGGTIYDDPQGGFTSFYIWQLTQSRIT